MGSLLLALCACGFSREIKEGPDGNIYLMPALCEGCLEFLISDYYKPKCPACGKRVIFFGEMEHKYESFILGEKKHIPAKNKMYQMPTHVDIALALPMAGNCYWCPKCGQKKLTFTYLGFWE